MALRALRRLAENSAGLARTSERLSSGMRINRASDDAAGLAVASALQANSRIYSQAIRNANDGISALNIADGGLEQLSSLVTRMKELATQAANGSYSAAQRRSMDTEAQRLKSEFERIQATTTFNGHSLISNNQSELSLQLGVGFHGKLNINVGIQGTGTSGSASTTYDFGGYDWSPSTGEASFGYAVGDVDGDGDGDYVTETDGLGTLTLRLWDGSAYGAANEFQSFTGQTVQGMAMGDLTGDNLDDLVVAYDTGYIEVFQASGGSLSSLGGFWASGGINAGTRPLIVDVDGDSLMDVVVAAGQNIDVMAGDGTGQLFHMSSRGTGSMVTRIVAADYNNDSNIDLVASRQGTTNLYFYAGNGGTSFAAGVATGVSGAARFAQMGTNLVVLGTSQSGAVFTSDGDGTFTQGPTFGSAFSAMNDLAVGDVNGDSVLDIVASDSGGGFTTFLAQNGGASYSFHSQFAPPWSGNVFDIQAYDINNDGLMDFYGRDEFTSVGAAGLSSATISSTDTTQTVIALQSFSLLSAASARSALTTLDSALDKVTATRSTIGAALSRIGSATAAIGALRDNYQQSASRILDADIAFESANYVRSQILQQTAASVLAQANLVPSLALTLLGR